MIYLCSCVCVCGWKSASAITLIKNQFYPINRVCSFGPLSHSAVEFLLSAAAARAEEMLLLTLIYRLEFSQRPRRASESVVEEAAVHVHHLCVDDYCFMGKTTERHGNMTVFITPCRRKLDHSGCFVVPENIQNLQNKCTDFHENVIEMKQ